MPSKAARLTDAAQRADCRTVAALLADQVFRDQGVYLPACYPRAKGRRVWLAVPKPVSSRIERAHLLAFDSIPTPIHDRSMAKLKAGVKASRRKKAQP